ncbi:hydrolase, partial [Enterococcus faecium]
MSEKWIPEIMTPLKQDIVKMPEIIRQASGIKIFGRKIKSIIFTTDIAIIRNTDAQAVIAVYP